MSKRQFHSTGATARRWGVSIATVRRACSNNPGLAIRANRHWRLPASHVEAVAAGASVAEVAAQARANAGDGAR